MKIEGASTQLTVLPLEWGAAVPRQVSERLLSGRSEWNRDIGSNPTANIRMPLEWDIFSMHGMCGQAMLDPWQLSSGFQHRWRVVQSPLKWWGHLSFFNKDGATSGRVTVQVWERELQRATPMEHPEGLSHVIGSIAKRLTRPVSGNLSEWSRITWALLRTGAPQESDGLLFFSEVSENWGTLTQW